MASVARISGLQTSLANLIFAKTQKLKDVKAGAKLDSNGTSGIKEQPPISSSVVIIDKQKESKNDKDLGFGWYRLSPFINGWVKVFSSKDKAQSVWMLVWVKDEGAALFHNIPYKPVPKNCLIYKYIQSNDPEKKKILQQCENILINSYLDAKRFIGNDNAVQSGFEIVGKRNYFMSVKGMCGIELTYPYVNLFLKHLEQNKEDEAIYCWYNFFKGGFAHEMTHELRDEISEKEGLGQEIASHAVEILSTGPYNPLRDDRFKDSIAEPETSYEQDMVASLKVVQQMLSLNEFCKYKPKSFDLEELNKAMESIPENKREETLKDIAGEIISSSPLELLKIAAQITIVPIRKKELEVFSEKLEKVS